MPMPFQNPIISCLIKIQNCSTFLVLAYPGCCRIEAMKRVLLSSCKVQLFTDKEKWYCLCSADICTMSCVCADCSLQLENVKEKLEDDINSEVSDTNNAARDFFIGSAEVMDIKVEDTDSYGSTCTSHPTLELSVCNDEVPVDSIGYQSTSSVENYTSCAVCQKILHCNSLSRHISTGHLHINKKRHHMSADVSQCQNTSGVEMFVSSCTVCQKVMHSSSLTQHMRLHTGQKPFACDVCEMRFVQKKDLEGHKCARVGERLFACDHCNTQFSNESELKMHNCSENFDEHDSNHMVPVGVSGHRNTKTAETYVSCKVCRKIVSRHKLPRHMRFHIKGRQSVWAYTSCPVCQKIVHYGSLTQHLRLHTGRRPFACQMCKRWFIGKNALDRHKCTHILEQPAKEPFACMQFSVESKFEMHTSSHSSDKYHSKAMERLHIKEKRDDIPVDISVCQNALIASNFVSCVLCHKVVSRHNLRRHMSLHINGRQNSARAACTVCQKVMHCSSLVRHMRLHSREKPFACDMCEMRYFQKSGLERHKRVHFLEHFFRCDACSTLFSNESELKLHSCTHNVDNHVSKRRKRVNKKQLLVLTDNSGCQNINGADKYVSCTLCRKIIHRQSMRRHMHLHVSGYQTVKAHVSCRVCQKSVHCNNLYRHMCLHTGEKPFACDMCEKRFIQKTEFERHKRTHIAKQSFACDICDIQLSNESELKMHTCTDGVNEHHSYQKEHLRVKQKPRVDITRRQNIGGKNTEKAESYVSCKVCQKIIHCNSLTRHMRLHSGQRLFACDLCNRRFFQKSGLVKHKHTHLKKQSFACDVCSAQFSNESELKRHTCTGNADEHYANHRERLRVKKRPYRVLVGHHKTAGTETYVSCKVCQKIIHCNSLTRHMRLHSGQRLFACDVCERWFFQKSGLDKHKCTHIAEQRFAWISDTQFTDESEFRMHSCSHIVDEHHANHREHLQVKKMPHHVRIDISGRQKTKGAEMYVSCKVCQKIVHRNSLTRHMHLHSGERLFVCDVCNRRFYQKSGLERHRLTHVKEMSFACDVCNTHFSDDSELKMHSCTDNVGEQCHVPVDVCGPQNTGRVDKYVSCIVCQKTLHNNSLMRHMRLHTGEKPFACDV